MVLNATLDLAALVLLLSWAVLAPFSGCWLVWPPSWTLKSFMWGWELVGVAAFLGLGILHVGVGVGCLAAFFGLEIFLGLEVVLAPFMWGWVLVGVVAFGLGSLHVWVGVGWCGRLLGP